MIVIDRNALRILELAWLKAFLAELGHERAIITREYLHSIVVAIDDEQETSMMVEHQAPRSVELAIGIASLLGANRELDSSITIKSIVFHLFQFNLSLSLSLSLSHRQDRNSKDVMCEHTHEKRREITRATSDAHTQQQQQQGTGPRQRSSNDTTTTKERSKEQRRHSLTKHHSLEPADLPFIRSLERMIDIDIDCIGVIQ